MKVLHLTSSFPRSVGDHVAPFLLDLCRAQARAGLDVAVLAPHDCGLARRERLGGVEVHRFRYGPAVAETLAYRGGLLGRTRTVAGLLALPLFLSSFTASVLHQTTRLRPDVLHAHWWLPAGACALLASRITGTPLVITVHGSDAPLLRRRGTGRIGLGVLRRAAAVAVVSAHLREQLIAAGVPAERIRVLRMPVATVPDRTPVPQGLPVRLLAAGRLSPEKGFDVLLRALGLAMQAGLDARLELVGSGPEQSRLEQLAGPLGERVRLLPAEPRERLLQRMASAHAVVVPSRREGLGLVALEALAVGRPVVASRIGGLPEVVAEADGVLVPAGDAAALAAALCQLPLPAPVGAALRQHAAESVAADHRDLYADLLAGAAR